MSIVTARGIIDALLDGGTATEVGPDIQRLPSVEHHALLCNLCHIRGEKAHGNRSVRTDRLRELDHLLKSSCSLYPPESVARCPESSLIGLHHLDKAIAPAAD